MLFIVSYFCFLFCHCTSINAYQYPGVYFYWYFNGYYGFLLLLIILGNTRADDQESKCQHATYSDPGIFLEESWHVHYLSRWPLFPNPKNTLPQNKSAMVVMRNWNKTHESFKNQCKSHIFISLETWTLKISHPAHTIRVQRTYRFLQLTYPNVWVRTKSLGASINQICSWK